MVVVKRQGREKSLRKQNKRKSKEGPKRKKEKHNDGGVSKEGTKEANKIS